MKKTLIISFIIGMSGPITGQNLLIWLGIGGVVISLIFILIKNKKNINQKNN